MLTTSKPIHLESNLIAEAKRIRLVPTHFQQKLTTLRNKKYKFICALMLDCGLRVTETVRLQIKHFNFQKREVYVQCLKKKKVTFRVIPLTDRVLEAAADYWTKVKNKQNPDTYLFPAGKGGSKPHACRKQVWRRLKAYTDGTVSPHDLRHTFATRIVNEGNEIRVAQKLLGHASMRTTEVYLHVEATEKRKAIESLQRKKWTEKLWLQLFPPRQLDLHILPMGHGLTKFHIGRKEEMAKLVYFGKQKINCILLGDKGVGKSHLLENYAHGKIIRCTELKELKSKFAGWLLEIIKQKPQHAEMYYNRPRPNNEIVEGKTTAALITDLIGMTTKGEYTIVIDDVTNITPSATRYLEKLANHFHILCAARKVEYKKKDFLDNFDRIELKPLSRPESMELIAKLTKPFMNMIEDFEAYKNHIWENTQGKPLYIIQMIERYSKEQNVSVEVVKEIRHTSGRREINFLPVFIGALACMSVLRYWGRITGTDNGPWYFLAAIGVIFLFFGREIIRGTKRKYV